MLTIEKVLTAENYEDAHKKLGFNKLSSEVKLKDLFPSHFPEIQI